MFVHWGNFTKQSSVNHALGFADGALRHFGFNEIDRSGHQVMGQDSKNTIVIVSWGPDPQGTAYTVTGVADVSTDAELARNNVRSDIVSVVLFDNG
ncbi:MAG: hypothetical protein QOJ46_2109 [bacterium]|jgi:hypothetical protein